MKAFRLGLTGSIGMGKSTTAACFADQGIPVWDADQTVHRLYARGGAAVGPMSELCPAAVLGGAIDREVLKTWIARDPGAIARIEKLVHPLVAADRAAFLAAQTVEIVLFDVPLLFEKGLDAEMDATLLVTAPQQLQRARVLARPGMTVALFDNILAHQMPDREKRARATHIVETLGLDAVRAYVAALIAFILENRHA